METVVKLMTKALVQQEKATSSRRLESDAAMCRSSTATKNRGDGYHGAYPDNESRTGSTEVEEEKLVTRPTLSQYPPMTGHMAKAIREIPHHLTRITMLMADTIKTKLLPAIRPIFHHKSIRHSRSLRKELSYMVRKANGDEAMTLAAETSRHDGN
jgi:hypothetical protein